MKNKDPYLSELDALGDLGGEEKTDLNIEEPPLEKKGKKKKEEPSTPLSSEGLEAARGVPVPLVVVLGRKEVSLQELVELRSGQILELDAVPNQAVDLVAQGRVVAKGELVEIDGKLGIRVLKILK